MKGMKRFLLLALAVFLVPGVIAAGLTISPNTFFPTVNGGETWQQTITVSGDFDKEVFVEIGYTIENESRDLNGFNFYLSDNNFFLSPGATKDVNLFISLSPAIVSEKYKLTVTATASFDMPEPPPEPSVGGGGGGGSSSSSLTLLAEGNCAGKPIVFTVKNGDSVVIGATVVATKNNATIGQATTGSLGTASLALDVGEYNVVATRSPFVSPAKTISVVDCSEQPKPPATTSTGTTGTGGTPRTTASTGGTQENTAQPEENAGTNAPAPTTGFFGLGSGQAVGAGLIVIALVAGILLMLKKKKKK